MDLARVREDARSSSTENLLDRVTVYRGEIEGPALGVIESELTARGIGSVEVDAHAAMRQREGLSRHADGTVVRCTYCPRPATEHRWKWYKLWGWFLPLFPRFVHLCKEHAERLPTDPHGRTLHYDAGQPDCREDPAV
jgi:hypothetical protein